MSDLPRVAITLLTNPVMHDHVFQLVELWRTVFHDAEVSLSPMSAYPTRVELDAIRRTAAGMGAERLIVAAAHQIPLTRAGALALLAKQGHAVVLRTSPPLMGMDLTTYRPIKEPNDFVARAFCTSCGLLPTTDVSVAVRKITVDHHPLDPLDPADFLEIAFTVPPNQFRYTSDVTHQDGLAGFMNLLPKTL